MNAERRLFEIARAKADMENVNDAFKKARSEFERVAHGGGKAEFNAAKAEYDWAFQAREKALRRCEFLGVDWTEGE